MKANLTLNSIWSFLFVLLALFAGFSVAHPEEQMGQNAEQVARDAQAADHWGRRGYGRGWGGYYGGPFYGGYSPYYYPYY